jgi:alpha-galactosidase
MQKPKKKLSNQVLAETGTAEAREENIMHVDVDGWAVLLELQEKLKPKASVENCNGFTLVHFDFPKGPLGEYQISVQQPFIDISHSWIGKFHSWQGLELTSIALNFSFDTSASSNLPVLCNYNREGINRGVIGMLDQVPETQVNQRPILETPPMHILQTKFTRTRKTGGFRETVVIYREKRHFAEAVKSFMKFCRQKLGIEPLPAPEWAREPVWCSWYSHLYVLAQHDIEEQITHLKKLGIRTVLIDASWFKKPEEAYFRKSGDYQAEKSLMPDLLGLSRRLHAEGLRIMLWCVPHFMGVHSQKRKVMEPYCVWDGTERGYHLCLFCKESRTHAKEMVERLMRDYELDGLKFDFMDHNGQPCLDPKHDHGDGNLGAATVEYMRAIREGVLKANPDAAIEYRVNFSNLATLPFANCHRGNDAPYDTDYIRRENLFLRLFCGYPSAIWNDYAYWHANEKPENISIMLGVQIFSGGVPTLSINLAQRSEAERRIIGRWMKFYRDNLDSLAKAELTVHSADSIMSVSSLQNLEKGVAFVLLAGQHIPAKINLKSGIRQIWVLNSSAEKKGKMEITAGKRSSIVKITGRNPVQVGKQ